MPALPDFLDRFRPAGLPGAAAARGIPVDRSAAAAAELMPVLARLDPVQDEAERLRAAALDQAADIRRAGRDDAAAVVRRARENTQRVAARAESVAMRSQAGAFPDVLDAATEAGVVVDRLPPYVEQVVSAARDLIAGMCAPPDEAAVR
ncbi:hypothetical protein [Nocardia sp. NPDC003963]